MIGAGAGVPPHMEWMYKDETTVKDIRSLLQYHEESQSINTYLDIVKALIKFPHFKQYKTLRHVTVKRLRFCYPYLEDSAEAKRLYKALFEKILETYEEYEKNTDHYRYMVHFLST